MLIRFISLIAGLAGICAHLGADSWVDPDNRWLIRDYFNTIYAASDGISMDWSGNYASGNAGSVSAAWQQATRQRVCLFRSMAGIPADVELDNSLTEACQEAALMMSVRNQISHTPGSGWQWYTADGAQAAAMSNLARGSTGPDAVEGYMMDFGSANANVGHRRWLLLPQLERIGNGDAPGSDSMEYSEINVMWVIPETMGPRPYTRDPYVAWPPRGYVPADLVYSRWSFSHPEADFTQAKVRMESAGQNLPLVVEERSDDSFSIGEPTIVWVPGNMPTDERHHWPVPVADKVIDVTVSDVEINGSLQDFAYTVIIFDPDTPGGNEYPTLAHPDGPVVPAVPATFLVDTRDWAEGFQARLIRTEPHTEVYDAENGLAPLEPDVASGFALVQSTRVATGSAAYHLANPNGKAQLLTIPGEFIVGDTTPSLQFDSSLAWASWDQVASIDINLGSGEEWQPIWEKYGPAMTNHDFETVVVDLSAWSGQSARFRLRYDLDGRLYYFNTGDPFGWAIDNIAFSGISRIISTEIQPVQAVDTDLVLTLDPGEKACLQVRDIAFGGHPLAWGPLTKVESIEWSDLDHEPGTWSTDPVFGLSQAVGPDWSYIPGLGWAYVAEFPWIQIDGKWICHVRGSLETGLWIYHEDLGYGYMEAGKGDLIHHAPFDDRSWSPL